MDRPKASIIIPTYNQDKYIVRAIQSALSQDYPNLEVIISDDNSGDGTKEVVEEYLLHRKIPELGILEIQKTSAR